MQIYLAVTPGQYQTAAAHTRSLAHAAYRIGPGSVLLRQDLPQQVRGGLLSVSDRAAPLIEAPEQLCAAALRECRRRSYAGVVLDFEAPPTPKRRQFAEMLAGKTTLYVPERYRTPGAVVLIGTAVSGGNFRQRLQEAAEQFGAGHMALDVERLRMDFTLPARNGTGVPLTGAELKALMDRERPAVFFSRDLCARYFTYLKGREIHFVLFDDAETLLEKLRFGRQLGCQAAFLLYPEVSDLLPKLFPCGEK